MLTMHLCRTFSKILFAFVLLWSLGESTPAIALEFRENLESGEISATGKIEIDDADKVSRIVNLEYKQRHRIVRGLVTLNFDSEGGSLLGGLRLGYALRALAVHTNIGAGKVCLSACAFAFLGGQQRTVEGKFGVHASRFEQGARAIDNAVQLDSVQ
jgi:hypothetical protein